MSLTDSALQQRLDEVYAGPSGPHIGAFFDFDGTLIHGFSAVDFYVDRIKRGNVGPVEGLQTLAMALRGITTEEDFEKFVGVGLAAFRGRPEEEILAAGDKVFRGSVAARVFPEAWQLVEAHQRMGHTVVLASSATRFQIQPAADVLGIKHVLFTGLEVDDAGNLTGRTSKNLWRSGKANAVREFAAANEIDLPASYGYSNGDEDIPFLEQVGHPAATTSEPRLRAHAVEQGWPVLDFRARGVLPGVSDLVRSGLAFGGLTTGMVTGAAFGLLNRSRQRAVDSMAALSSELALTLAGIQVEVQGEEHLWSERPAVFIFNHQSQLDLPLMGYLLRHGFTGVAKQELKRDPIVGLPFRFAGVAFVDRKGGKDPRKALAPAVEKLREGVSIALAPEGTRSLTPTLGPFKTGGFFLAREAGVPVVPVVIRNAGELMWRDSLTLKPGTIQVVVLPPIDVSQWQDSEIRQRVAEVRQMYADTLARWPQGPATLGGVATEAHTPGEVDVANLAGEPIEPEPDVSVKSSPRTARKPAAQVAAEEKAAAKKAATKKAATKKTAAKKSTTKKTTTKAAAKKTATTMAATEKTAAQKTTTKKTTTKAATKKASAQTASAKKAAAKKTAAKKTTTKAATKKASAQTASAKKVAAKKSPVKKSSVKKSPAKETTAKKSTTKTTPAKKQGTLAIAPRSAPSATRRNRTRGSIVDLVSPDA